MKETKVTKVDILKVIAGMIADEDLDAVFGTTESGADVTGAEIVAFAKLTISQLEDKSAKAKVKAASKKGTKDQITLDVLSVMTSEWQTLDEIVDAVNEITQEEDGISRAKVTSRITMLVNEGLVIKEKAKVDKRTIMQYSLTSENSTEETEE